MERKPLILRQIMFPKKAYLTSVEFIALTSIRIVHYAHYITHDISGLEKDLNLDFCTRILNYYAFMIKKTPFKTIKFSPSKSL